jgi:hypothetical protein
MISTSFLSAWVTMSWYVGLCVLQGCCDLFVKKVKNYARTASSLDFVESGNLS